MPALPYNEWLWVDMDVSDAGWPELISGGYYWVTLALAARVNLLAGNANFDGVTWGGISDLDVCAPPEIRANASLYTGRELTTERFFRDTAFDCSTAAAVSLVEYSANWARVVNASVRYTDWTSSHVRYGVEISGWRIPSSPTSSPSRAWGRVATGAPQCPHPPTASPSLQAQRRAP